MTPLRFHILVRIMSVILPVTCIEIEIESHYDANLITDGTASCNQVVVMETRDSISDGKVGIMKSLDFRDGKSTVVNRWYNIEQAVATFQNSYKLQLTAHLMILGSRKSAMVRVRPGARL